MIFFPFECILQGALLPTHGLRLLLFFPDSVAFQCCLLYFRAVGEQQGNEGWSWCLGPALPGRAAVFPLLFTKEACQENDSTLSIINLAEQLNHLLAARC